MGTFNVRKGEIGITAIYDSSCGTCEYDDDDFFLCEDVKNEIGKISSWDDTFPYDVFYSLSDIFKIKIEAGHYNGFSIYIDSPFSIKDMGQEIKAGLFKPNININIKDLDREDVKMDTFLQYIAEEIAAGVDDNITGDAGSEDIIKDIKNIIKKYFNYLNYNIAKIGRDYNLYNLIRNGWVRTIEPFNNDMINQLKCNVL